MKVHLVDGTYELFRQFFGQPSRRAADGAEVAATRGVVSSIVAMLADGVTHLGVATDHVIESFRNELWAGYKTGELVPAELKAQFPLLEAALEGLGVVVWPMVELEADDAMASAAAVAVDDVRVEQVIVCSPDKDLAQCVAGRRVVQLDRRSGAVTDEEGVWARFGVAPASIPDWLALVGDSADGYPGLAGWGRRSASAVLAHYRRLDAVPPKVADWDPAVRKAVRGAPGLAARLEQELDRALLFRTLATLQVERSLLDSVDELHWYGPGAGFEDLCRYLQDPALAARAARLGSAQ
jgi:5'-3' exonuclease